MRAILLLWAIHTIPRKGGIRVKASAFNHRKVLRLGTKLRIERWAARGLVQSLWMVAAQETPDGGIGVLANDEIAEYLGWAEREADELIDALLSVGLLDEHPGCRLYIHDHHEHCEDAVHMKLGRCKKWFANGMLPKLTRLNKDERPEIEKFYRTNSFNPNCAHTVRTSLPSQAMPIPSHPTPGLNAEVGGKTDGEHDGQYPLAEVVRNHAAESVVTEYEETESQVMERFQRLKRQHG